MALATSAADWTGDRLRALFRARAVHARLPPCPNALNTPSLKQLKADLGSFRLLQNTIASSRHAHPKLTRPACPRPPPPAPPGDPRTLPAWRCAAAAGAAAGAVAGGQHGQRRGHGGQACRGSCCPRGPPRSPASCAPPPPPRLTPRRSRPHPPPASPRFPPPQDGRTPLHVAAANGDAAAVAALIAGGADLEAKDEVPMRPCWREHTHARTHARSHAHARAE